MMGEQEMQFADPDWKPLAQRQTQSGDVAAYVPQPVNSRAYDPGNTGQPATSYEQGYRGPLLQQQTPYAPPDARQVPTRPAANTRRRSRWWVWVIILIVIFSIINGANHSSSSYGPGPFSRPYNGGADSGQQTTSFDLANVSLVHISDWGDSIQLQQGDPNSGQVQVQSDAANMDQPQEAMDGNTLTITVSPAQGGNTIVVTLPPGVAVSLETTYGNIEVDGFSGQVSARADTGSITLNNDALTGTSVISTNSGDISLSQGSASNTTALSSNSGSVTLDQEALSGQFSTNVGAAGTISFTGTLDPKGTYKLTSYQGNIDLTLPSDTSMQVQESTGPGASFSSDFPQSTGKTPQAALNLETTSGALSIRASG